MFEMCRLPNSDLAAANLRFDSCQTQAWQLTMDYYNKHIRYPALGIVWKMVNPRMKSTYIRKPYSALPSQDGTDLIPDSAVYIYIYILVRSFLSFFQGGWVRVSYDMTFTFENRCPTQVSLISTYIGDILGSDDALDVNKQLR